MQYETHTARTMTQIFFHGRWCFGWPFTTASLRTYTQIIECMRDIYRSSLAWEISYVRLIIAKKRHICHLTQGDKVNIPLFDTICQLLNVRRSLFRGRRYKQVIEVDICGIPLPNEQHRCYERLELRLRRLSRRSQWMCGSARRKW